MQKYTTLLLFLGLICLCHPVAQAQTQDSLTTRQLDSLTRLKEDVQRQIKLLKPSPEATKEPDFKLKFTGRAILTSGNINRSFLEGKVSLSYQRPSSVITLDMNPRFAYGRQSGLLAERDYGTDFSANILDYMPLHGIVFGFVERSNLRKIDLRALAGGGIAWRILKGEQHKLSLSNAVIYEVTDFATDTRSDINIIRNSARVKGEHILFQKKLRIKHLLLFQPAINANNLRWNGTFTLEMPITARFSMQASLDNSYESEVVEGRKRNDTRLTVGFSLSNWAR